MSDRPELEARRRRSAAAFDYCVGGAFESFTVDDNVRSFDRYRIVPSFLADRDCTEEGPDVLGGSPVYVAPMGLQAMIHPDAEIELARGAAAAGVPVCLSMFSSSPFRDVARAMGDVPLLAQVYPLSAVELLDAYLDEVLNCGARAIVLTVDAPHHARRPLHDRHGVDRFAAYPPAIVRRPEFEAEARRVGAQDAADILRGFFPNPAQALTDVQRLVDRVSVPVLVKGVLSIGDVERVMGCRASGVVVSNHGGRNLDRVITSIDALRLLVAALPDLGRRWLDSGVRSGTHVFIALRIGAEAVGLGRPVWQALANGGRTAVTDFLRLLLDDLHRVRSIAGRAGIFDSHTGWLLSGGRGSA